MSFGEPNLLQTRLSRLGAAAKESAKVAKDDLAARDAAIREADAAGMALHEIAKAVGLAASSVHGILVGRDKRERAAA